MSKYPRTDNQTVDSLLIDNIILVLLQAPEHFIFSSVLTCSYHQPTAMSTWGAYFASYVKKKDDGTLVSSDKSTEESKSEDVAPPKVCGPSLYLVCLS